MDVMLSSGDETWDAIVKYGHITISAASGPRNRPCVYTLGHTISGLPELLFVSSADLGCATLLNLVSRVMVENGRAFADGEYVRLGGERPVKVINVPAELVQEFKPVVGSVFDPSRLRMQQVLLADHEGWFPDEPAYDVTRAPEQLLLGQPKSVDGGGFWASPLAWVALVLSILFLAALVWVR